jgi:hypothetical protein
MFEMILNSMLNNLVKQVQHLNHLRSTLILDHRTLKRLTNRRKI